MGVEEEGGREGPRVGEGRRMEVCVGGGGTQVCVGGGGEEEEGEGVMM